MTLTDFLLARIAEEQALAQRVAERTEHVPPARIGGVGNLGIVGFPFARVLAECDAKRRIVELHEDPHECLPWGRAPDEDCSTLLAAAAIYSDHPDYREEWRP